MMEGNVLLLLLVISATPITDAFQWSSIQLSSHVINAYLGSNAKLPCQFTLSSEEQQQSQQFYAILWSREAPFGSKQWEALTASTHISGLNNSLPQILFPSKNKFSLKNNNLSIYNIGLNDDTQYQCEFKSSFYTSPSVIKVNVVYRPVDTKIYAPAEPVKQKSPAIINCTARANPKPGFAFYHNNQLVQNSTSQYFVINATLSRHKGEYTCIPWNYYGNGPNATITLKVQDVKITDDSKLLSDEIIAGITGAVVLVLVIIIVAAIMCQRIRSGKEEVEGHAKNTRDLKESHLGPAMYGSDASIVTSETKTSSKDLRGPQISPAIYGSDIKVKDSSDDSLKFEPDIPKERTIFYGPESNFSMTNGTYTPREQKLFKLEGSRPNGIPVDSDI